MSEWVEVYVTQFREEAEVVEALLRGAGLRTLVQADDAGGTNPSLGWLRGVRVLVPSEEEAAARETLSAPAEDEGRDGE